MRSTLLPHEKLRFEDIAAFALQRWQLVLVCSFGLMMLAIMAWRNIARREEPKVEVPVCVVTIPYPGASPEDVESQIIKVVEEDLFALNRIKTLDSSAMPNVAQMTLQFEDDVNMDVMVEKVRGKIQARKKDMPAEVKDPDIIQLSSDNTTQMLVAVAGNRSDDVLTDAAKQLKKQISLVSGVSGVDIRGDQKRAVRVQLDAMRLAQHALSADAVVRQLQLANVRIPAGELKVGPLLTMLQVNQELRGAESAMKVAVGGSTDTKGGSQVVTLGEVAQVKDGALTMRERFLHNNQPAVALEVRFRPSEDAVAVGNAVRRTLQQAEKNLPDGVHLAVLHDQPAYVDRDVSNFIESLVEGILLVVVVITLGMGWRSAIVVSAVLPLAAAGAIFGLYTTGCTVDGVSIVGLIVALGLLVDDAVVVTESIQIMRDKGLSSVRAAVFGTARVFWANNGTTLVACSSFLPLFFMGGGTGDYIRSLPIAVITALGTSLVVAQLVTPWISTFLIRNTAGAAPIPDPEPFDRSQDTGGEHEEKNPALRYLKGLYARKIPWIIRNPLKVIALATVMFVGALVVLPKVGIEFFPRAERHMLFVGVQAPRGSHEEIVAQKVVETAMRISKQPGIVDTSAMVGAGYPQIFGGHVVHGPSRDFGEILVRIEPMYDTETVAARLRQDLAAIPGVNIAVQEFYLGPAVPHPISIRIYGDEYTRLRAYAGEVKAKLREQKGAINVSDSLTESIPFAKVALDTDKAKRVGLTPGQIGGTLRWLYGEDKVTEFRDNDELITVVIEPISSPDSPLDAVEQTLIPSGHNVAVPLRQAGSIALDRGFAELSRHNGRRAVTVVADVDAGVLPSAIVEKMDPWLRAMTWDPGYGFNYGGSSEETSKSFANLGMAGVGALVLIFTLLVLIFSSLKLSFLVMLAVPYVMIGAVSGLALTGNHFGFMSFLGLIALIGVYVNHKIYFVDRMQELVNRGQDRVTAIINAGQDRLRPVVLTALTAILGLLPLTLTGGLVWSGFGWVNIFGLLASIPLSLVLLPAFISVAFRLSRHPSVAPHEASGVAHGFRSR